MIVSGGCLCLTLARVCTLWGPQRQLDETVRQSRRVVTGNGQTARASRPGGDGGAREHEFTIVRIDVQELLRRDGVQFGACRLVESG